MSHEATNWAIKQRGLKPTTKIVLWHLCDRFNPDYGCFPSQDRLAHDCEISRSTLNDHLGQLEAVGLLRRVPRLDPVTKRQLPTRYILGFEPGFTPVAVVPCPETGHGDDGAAESPDDAYGCAGDSMADAQPCPDFGHGIDAEPVSDFPADPCPENAESRVRISDTNPVREPLSKPVKEEEGAQTRAAISDEVFGELLDALGLDPAALPGWWQGWPPRLHVQRWRDELGLTEAEIIAAAEASRREHPEPPDGPKALDRAMQRASQRKVENAGRKRRKPRVAPPTATKPITDLPAFYADLVNSNRYLPVSAISNTMRDAMLARALVTPERLREGVLAISGTSRRVGSPGDERVGLTKEQIDAATDAFREERIRAGKPVPETLPPRIFCEVKGRRPLIILRFVEPVVPEELKAKSPDLVLAWSICFPPSEVQGGTVEYIVNTIRMREMFGEEEIEEEALGDTD